MLDGSKIPPPGDSRVRDWTKTTTFSNVTLAMEFAKSTLASAYDDDFTEGECPNCHVRSTASREVTSGESISCCQANELTSSPTQLASLGRVRGGSQLRSSARRLGYSGLG